MITAAITITVVASTACLLFIILCQYMTLKDYEKQLARKPLGRLSKSDHAAMLQTVKDLHEYHSDTYTKVRMGFIITKLEAIDA